jgi:hypothetical protein
VRAPIGFRCLDRSGLTKLIFIVNPSSVTARCQPADTMQPLALPRSRIVLATKPISPGELAGECRFGAFWSTRCTGQAKKGMELRPRLCVRRST